MKSTSYGNRMESTINVLMTGAGAPGAAGVIKCLLQESAINLLVADADENAVGRHIHPHFVTIPKAFDEGFVASLLRICGEKQIHTLMPLVTRELFPLSQSKELFQNQGTTVLVSSAESINLSADKSASYRVLQEKGIEVPRFSVVSTTEQFIHAAFELGHPKEPFCFKPSRANGSRGFRIVSDSINESDRLFNHKPYNTYITYTHALKILSSQPFPELLVSEYLPGDEYSVDCLARNGSAILVVPRRREKTVGGISVQGTFEEDKEITDYCRTIIETIGLHGNIGIQIKYSANNKPLLLEINPRVQGTVVSALGAGVNLPLLAVKQALQMELPQEDMSVKWGTRFSRHWTEVWY